MRHLFLKSVVSTSFLLLLVRPLFLVAMHLFLVAQVVYFEANALFNTI